MAVLPLKGQQLVSDGFLKPCSAILYAVIPQVSLFLLQLVNGPFGVTGLIWKTDKKSASARACQREQHLLERNVPRNHFFLHL